MTKSSDFLGIDNSTITNQQLRLSTGLYEENLKRQLKDLELLTHIEGKCIFTANLSGFSILSSGVFYDSASESGLCHICYKTTNDDRRPTSCFEFPGGMQTMW